MHTFTRALGLVLVAGTLVLGGGAFAADEHGTTGQAPAHETAAAPGAEAAHGEGHAAVPHLQSVLGLAANQMGDTKAAHFLRTWQDPLFSIFTILILATFFIVVGTHLRDSDPGRPQLLAEAVIGGLYGLFEQVLGREARRFTPYLGTLFLFILVNNWLGMVPLGHASTSSFANTTIGLGLLTFLYVQYVGIKENGLGGYLYHFAGQPKSGLEWGFAILIFPLEVMGELIKPLSLSLRLFGNIFGEDTLVAVMVLLGTNIVYGLTGNPYVPGLPLHFPFYFLGLIATTVQALVFTLLSTIYIALMLPHHDHEEAAHGHAAH